MNRRAIFKLLTVLPFVGVKAIVAEPKKYWLVTSGEDKPWAFPHDVTFPESGLYVPKGPYPKFVMRFDSLSSAVAFKSMLMPTNSDHWVKTTQETDTDLQVIRSGYRGAIRAMYRKPTKNSYEPAYWTIVAVEDEEACILGKKYDYRFPSVSSTWAFIDSMIIKEDDGITHSRDTLWQPFKRNMNLMKVLDV